MLGKRILLCVGSLFTLAHVMHRSRYMQARLRSSVHITSNSESNEDEITICIRRMRSTAPTTMHFCRFLSWRQLDVTVKNMYNTVCWSLVLSGGLSNIAVEHILNYTVSSDKNEIGFGEFSFKYRESVTLRSALQ